MVYLRSTLGQRIVEVARLALALHMCQDQQDQTQRQREATGGAGPRNSRDGELTALDDRLVRSSHFAEGGAE